MDEQIAESDVLDSHTETVETWQERYDRESKEQEERIKSIRETAIFRVKAGLYGKVTPQAPFNRDIENDETFDARMQAMIDKHMPEAMSQYVNECVKQLVSRGNIRHDDWRKCFDNMYAVGVSVKGVVNSAHGRDYWG